MKLEIDFMAAHVEMVEGSQEVSASCEIAIERIYAAFTMYLREMTEEQLEVFAEDFEDRVRETLEV